ncbi:hypothetical protein BS333_09535 [Vibrio azureus]|uniref:Uncharacterized protein n=1 Tax=Vibrio azureus NBRC 104587 TaxID=1219077 RepID=U3C9C9_9VIBR|nr:hypothetical protein [Vibrio azureus]AUI86604.1 hypothetical protein BS333_09535 [Vibrio azureus]GAD75033.1 hypothetical protein VAZ01S_018_00090 [Vibrio azureus NBRC 104587]
MKLNKQEVKAVEDMQSILDAIKHPESKGCVCLSSGDITNIERVLGIDLWKATLGNCDIQKVVRGKEHLLMKICFKAGGQYPAERHCFFPFQVRAKATK